MNEQGADVAGITAFLKNAGGALLASLGQARPADAIDIVVIAVLGYATIAWLRRAQSRFVIFGVAILAALYLVAQALDMHLTVYLFQAAFTIALVALVVIFQEEIRRAFERIAMRGTRGDRDRATPNAALVETTVSSAEHLARTRTGALIVFRGREPLERHFSAGVELGGAVSEQLLFSIFDSSSPGHDGAVVIIGGRLERFAVHLPLSTKAAKHPGGTRHAAGLGVSERSDAFVIVVSEERGVISVAEAGEIATVTPRELGRRLTAFLESKAPARRVSRLRSVLTEDVGAKAFSLLVATLAWVVLFGQRTETVARTLSVPVVYRNVPEAWQIEPPEPSLVQISVSGPSGTVLQLEPHVLAVSLDAARVRAGTQSIVLGPHHVTRPKDVSIVGFQPPRVEIKAHQMVPTRLPVKVRTRGLPRNGLHVLAVRADPPRVLVEVRKGEQSRFTFIATELVDLGQLERSRKVTANLVLPPEIHLAPETRDQVTVTIALATPSKSAPTANP